MSPTDAHAGSLRRGFEFAVLTGNHSDPGMGEVAIPIPYKSAIAIFGVNGGDFREWPRPRSEGEVRHLTRQSGDWPRGI
jgi:hypothetical protein